MGRSNNDSSVRLQPPLSMTSSVAVSSSSSSPSNPDAWRPPEDWDYIPTHEIMVQPLSRDMLKPIKRHDNNQMSLDLNGMVRELKRMAAASPKLTLLRLSEEWGKSTDATLYKELELEKKRWMLAALYNIDRNLEQDLMRDSGSPVRQEKVLALYENQGQFRCRGLVMMVLLLMCDQQLHHF